MSASRSVQLLETEPSPLLVLGCGTVCHAADIVACDTLPQFRRELKTFLFRQVALVFSLWSLRFLPRDAL